MKLWYFDLCWIIDWIKKFIEHFKFNKIKETANIADYKTISFSWSIDLIWYDNEKICSVSTNYIQCMDFCETDFCQGEMWQVLFMCCVNGRSPCQAKVHVIGKKNQNFIGSYIKNHYRYLFLIDSLTLWSVCRYLQNKIRWKKKEKWLTIFVL